MRKYLWGIFSFYLFYSLYIYIHTIYHTTNYRLKYYRYSFNDEITSRTQLNTTSSDEVRSLLFFFLKKNSF